MANPQDYENWLKQRSMAVTAKGEAPSGVSPTFMPKYSTAAEAAKARGQTDFTPETGYNAPAIPTVRKVSDFGQIGMTPDQALGFPPYQMAKAGIAPAQRGRYALDQYQARISPQTPQTPQIAVKQVATTPSQQVVPVSAKYYGTDPRALEEWNANARVNADISEFRNGKEAGYVREAYSNVPGTASIKMGGFAPTSEAMRGGYYSAPKTFADYEKQLASMKGDTTRAIAFKPGERRPVGMNLAQQQEYDRKQQQKYASGEAAVGRAAELQMSENEKQGMIGKAEAERQGALDVQKMKNEGDSAITGKIGYKDLNDEETLLRPEITYTSKEKPTLTPEELSKNAEINARLARIAKAKEALSAGASGGGQVSAVKAPPAVGTVSMGKRFKGGNPADPNAWEKV